MINYGKIRDDYKKETKEDPYCSYNDVGGNYTDNCVDWLEKKIIDLKADVQIMMKISGKKKLERIYKYKGG